MYAMLLSPPQHDEFERLLRAEESQTSMQTDRNENSLPDAHSQLSNLSGVDRVLEETVTRHHLWELADLAALAGEMNLHVHVCRSAFPCMQRPRLAAMSNHFLFFVRVLRSLEKRACFS
jgi:hypothetical protein